MNKKYSSKLKLFAVIILILMLLVMPATYSEDSTREYKIPHVVKHINVSNDASVNIEENMDYIFIGTFNGVYRDIPLSGYQSVENISVETPGLYNTVEVTNYSTFISIKVYLYKDAEKTQRVSDENVKIIYHYTFIKGVKIYNDVAEIQYMTWGDEWEEDVDNLESYITIPGSKDNVEMWNNPSYHVISSDWTNDNTLYTNYSTIKSGKTAEQRILMPKSYFISTDNADVINKDAKTIIENNQDAYQDSINFNFNITYIIFFVSLILVVAPFLIYHKYGKEPNIYYDSKYEIDIPTNDSPLFINAVVPGNVNEINLDAFYASILDLIDRGYMKVVTYMDDDTILSITSKNQSDLYQYEKDILGYFGEFEFDNGDISFKRIKDRTDPIKFQKFLDDWDSNAYNAIDHRKISSYFNFKGATIFKNYGLISIIYAIVAMIYVLLLNPEVPTIDLAFRTTVLLVPEGILILLFDNTVGGQWTTEGKYFHDRWKHFENYIKDYSMIKQYPPASVQVWGRYIVYATSLGIAKTVNKNMKKYFNEMNIPKETIYNSDTAYLSYLGLNMMMYSTFHDFKTYTPPSEYSSSYYGGGSFGNIGGPGSGGFGGGGGGAF